jgi:hypothetical protein
LQLDPISLNDRQAFREFRVHRDVERAGRRGCRTVDRAAPRNRWFVDSPLDGNGFELPVPRQIDRDGCAFDDLKWPRQVSITCAQPERLATAGETPAQIETRGKAGPHPAVATWRRTSIERTTLAYTKTSRPRRYRSGPTR